jgi:ADP-heptose:LPS heptosyltransferase
MAMTTFKKTIRKNTGFPSGSRPSSGQLAFSIPKYTVACNADIKRLLYIRLDAIGDAVLAASLLPSLRILYPNAEIVAVCNRSCAPVYAEAKLVDRIVELDAGSLRTPEGFQQAQRILAALHADIVLNFTRSNSEATLILSLLCDAPLIAVANNTSNMLSDIRDHLQRFAACVIPLPDELPEIELYDHVLDFYGLEHAPCSPYMPVGNEARKKAQQLWSKTGFAPDKTIAAFAAGRASIRDYPLLGAALVPICTQYGFSVLTLGGKDDGREVNGMVVDTLRKHGIPSLNLSGRLQLAESAALLADCRLAVGVETSLAHIACALSVPNVILLGGGYFGRFMPYSPKTTAVCLPLECFNCEWRCRYPNPYCIKGIMPSVITQAVETALENGDAGKFGRLVMQQSIAPLQSTDMPRLQIPRKYIAARQNYGLDSMTVS